MATIEQYRAMLPVHKHRLDDELEIQADIMDRISTQVVIHNSRAQGAKEELAKVEARLLEDARDGETKMTLDLVKARVQRDPERARAWQKYQEARALHESWVGLLDAWRNKGFSIKTLADLYSAQYFSLNSHQISQRQRQRDEDGDANRAALRKAGHRDRQVDVEAEVSAPRSTRRTMAS